MFQYCALFPLAFVLHALVALVYIIYIVFRSFHYLYCLYTYTKHTCRTTMHLQKRIFTRFELDGVDKSRTNKSIRWLYNVRKLRVSFPEHAPLELEKHRSGIVHVPSHGV